MNLHAKLKARGEAGRPVRVGVIGAGKFGAMFLAQARRTAGLHVVAIADQKPGQAAAAALAVGWPAEQLEAASPVAARDAGTTHCGEDALALLATAGLEVVIDATGQPAAGIRHALAAIGNGLHMVMVNVEADVLAGPLLARRARQADLVYSLAYGDQPALIAEQVDWARTAGLEVVCAGKGTKYRPSYHRSTPETVWQHYGLTPEHAARSGMNPKMFNSFLDGTKSAIEMAAVANATGLKPQPSGLHFPPAAAEDLAGLLRPREIGGILDHEGTVEVVSCVDWESGEFVPGHIRYGVFVAFKAADEYVSRCFQDYGLVTDATGRYSALWRPYHLIGLELGISVASAALRGEPTGAAIGFGGDVAATAKRALKAGEVLDGEGGFTVYGRLTSAETSLDRGLLPLGLAHGVRLRRDLPEDAVLTYDDVVLDQADPALRFRREMEAAFRQEGLAAAE